MPAGNAKCVLCHKRMSERIRCLWCQRHVCLNCSCDCKETESR